MSIQASIPSSKRPFRAWTVLDKLIVRDLLYTALSVLLVLVMIIVSQKFIRVLAQAIEGNISNETVMSLLLFKTITVMATFTPVAAFMAILMVFGRMYRDQEMAAIASAGGGLLTLYRSVFLLLIPFSIASAFLSIYASPWAESQSNKMMHEDSETSDLRSITPGKFTEYKGGELIFYSEVLDPKNGKMRNVFIQNRQKDKLGIANAEYGHIENLEDGTYLILENGQRSTGVPGRKDYSIETYQEYAVLIERKLSQASDNAHTKPSTKLASSTDVNDIAELQDRVNGPIGVLLLGFLAVPLSRIAPRGGVYGNLALAFGIYFAYSNLLRISHSWVVAGKITPFLGYYGVNLLLFTIGLMLVARLYGLKWIQLNITHRNKI